MSRNNGSRYGSEPLVSILVPTYNRKWLLPRTLKSLLNQSYKNLDIVLVNDAGEDVQDVVNELNDSRINYIQNQSNLNLAGTRNVALKHAKGNYICLCDDDDIYLPYAIEFRMYMIKKLNAEIVYTRSLLDHWHKTDNGYQSVQKTLYWDSEYNKDLILIQNIAPCLNPLFSRKSWEDSNYWFDETLTTTEDHDFWIALSRRHDFHNLQLVDAECSQRDDKSQMTNNLDFSKNWIKVFKKWRHTAENFQYVKESQNNILRQVGINPINYEL
jgi:glycosyltransferase involved in cell wall biosynthesis